MGTLKTIIILILLLSNSSAFSQIIKIRKNDSIQLKRLEEYSEDGLTFYKNEYILIIYNKNNINFNKKNGYKYKEYAGGAKYCDKCKKESYGFSVKKVKNISTQKYNYYTTEYLLNSVNKHSVGGGYFIINGIYYKNLGMPIE